MTLQEKFNLARKNLQDLFDYTLSFDTSETNEYTVKTEIYIDEIILSVGFYRDSIKTNNDSYLKSMLNAIANYELALIPKE